MAAPWPPNPNGYPPKTQSFKQRQIEIQDRFFFYRTFGLGKKEYDAGRRARAIARRQQPVRQAARAPVTDDVPAPGSKAAIRMGWQIYQTQGTMGPAAKFPIDPSLSRAGKVTLNRQPVRDLLAWGGVRFVRVLGWVSRIHIWDPFDACVGNFSKPLK